MILLEKINGKKIVINAELIETIEETPDSVITFTNGKKILVKNSLEDIVRRVIEYKRKISHIFKKLLKGIPGVLLNCFILE